VSKTIDEKVVELTFDNAQFESNVKTSMSTIEKLKNALNFKGASDGLDKLSKSAKSLDMSSASESVGVLQARFSALQIAGMTAISNITSEVMRMGAQLADAVTIAPVRSGFQEYETQIGAIQTILANTSSKGSTLDDVNSALDELNKYADQTIYNFTEMTRNIGTFTAAGVDLDSSVSAIKGIANLAAVSGSTSTQASTAMYQLSQALAAGTVKLMDWNSVVNAGMGGEVFQTALKRTSRMMKATVSDYTYDVDQLIESNGSFRESLSEGWLTADVLTETLAEISGAYSEADLLAKGYTDDQVAEILELSQTATDAATKVKTFTQLLDTTAEALGSGWTQTWEIIIGDFEQAKELWTGISDFVTNIVNNIADARNTFLTELLGSPWEQLTSKIEATGVPLDEFTAKLQEVAIQNGVLTQEMVDSAGSLEDTLSSGWLTTDIFNQTIDAMSETSTAVDDMTDKLEYFQKVVDEVWYGTWDNGQARVEKLTEAGYDYAEVQALVNKTVDGHRLTLEDLDIETAKAIGYTDEQIAALQQLKTVASESGSSMEELINSMSNKSGRELILEALQTAFNNVYTVLTAVKGVWDDVFPAVQVSTVYGYIEAFNEFTKSLTPTEDALDKIKRAFSGVFKIAKLVGSLVTGVLSRGFQRLSKYLGVASGGILDLSSGAGDLLGNFADWVEQNDLINKSLDTLDGLLDAVERALSPVIDGIKEFVSVVSTTDEDVSFIDGIQIGLQNAYDWIKTKVGDIGAYLRTEFEKIPTYMSEGFSLGLSSGFEGVLQAIATVVENIIYTVKSILGIHSPSTVFKEIGENTIQGFIDGVFSKMSSANTAISEFASNIINAIGNFDWSQAVPLALSGAMFASLYKFGDSINNLGTAIGNFSGVTASIKGFFTGLTTGFTELKNLMKTNIRLNIIKTIGEALVLLAGSFAILVATVHYADKSDITTAVGIFILFVAGLAAITAASSKLENVDLGNINKVGVMAIEMAAAMVILSVAVQKLAGVGELDWSQFAQIALFLGLFGTLTLGLVAIAKLATTEQITAASSIAVSVGAGLILVAMSMKMAGGMSTDQFKQAESMLLSFAGVVMAFIVVGNLGSKANVQKVGAMVLEIAAAILVMGVACNYLGHLDKSTLSQGYGAILAFSAIVVGLMAATKLMGTGDVASASSGILAVAGAITILAVAVRILGGLDTAVLVKGELAVLALGVIVSGLLLAVKAVGGTQATKIAATLLSMAVAVGILAAVAVVLGMCPLEDLLKGTAIVAALGVVVALMAKSIAGVDAKSVAKMVILGVIVGELAAIVYLFSQMDTSSLLASAGALVALLTSLALLSFANSKSAKASSFIAMIPLIAAVGAVVYALANYGGDYNSAITGASAMSLLILSLIPVFAACTLAAKMHVKSSDIAKVSLAFDSLLLLVAGAGVVVALLAAAGLDYSSAITGVEALAIMINSMIPVFAACAIAAKVGVNPVAIAQVGLAFDALVALVGVLTAAVGALEQLTDGGLSKTIEAVVPVFTAIGDALGSLIGSFAGSLIGSSVSTMLTDIGNSLVLFSTQLSVAGTQFSRIPSGAFDIIGEVAGALAQLAGAEIATAVANVLSMFGGTGSFVDQMSGLAAGLSAFDSGLGNGFKSARVRMAAQALSYVSDMFEAIPSTGGVLSWFAGTKDFSGFGDAMGSFGEGLAAFSDAVSGGSFDTGAISAAVEAAKPIVELAGDLPTEGGFLNSVFFGETVSFDTFGTQLTAFGEALIEFCSTMSSLTDISSLDAAKNATSKIMEIVDLLPEKEGAISLITGGNMNMAEFAVQLGDFGTALATFNSSVAGIDAQTVTGGIEAGMKVLDFLEKVPTDKGLLQNFIDFFAGGGDGTSSLRSSFKNVAYAIKSLGSGDTALSSQELENAKTVCQGIDELSTVISGMGIIDSENVQAYADALEALGRASVEQVVSGFEGGASDVKAAISSFTESIADAISSATANIDVDMDDYGEIMASHFSTGFVNGFKTFSTTIATQLKNILRSISNYRNSFRTSGMSLAEQFNSGFVNNIGNLGSALTTALRSAVSSARSWRSAFYSAGSYIASGLSSGISSSSAIASVSSASTTLTKSAVKAGNRALAIKSPSKVFYQMGSYAGQGFSNALLDYADVSYKSGETMTNASLQAAEEGMSKLAAIIDSDIEYQPVVRPIMDLSDIKNGANTLNALLNSQNVGGATFNMAQSARRLSSGIQNGSSPDVVDAISKLRTAVESMSSNTVNLNGLTVNDNAAIVSDVEQLLVDLYARSGI